jgi:hypothetical protein
MSICGTKKKRIGFLAKSPRRRLSGESPRRRLSGEARFPCCPEGVHSYYFIPFRKIVFGENSKTILPEYNCNQDLVF